MDTYPVDERPGRGRGSGIRNVLLVSLTLFAVAMLSRNAFYGWMGGSLISVNDPVKGDAIVVVGGMDGKREILASELMAEGYAPRIVLTGGVAGWGHSVPSIMAEHLRRTGTEMGRVMVQPPAATDDAAVALLGPLAKRRGWHTLIVIASPFESRRIRALYNRHFPAPYHRVCVVACPEEEFGPESWWTCPRGRDVVITEWQRLLTGS